MIFYCCFNWHLMLMSQSQKIIKFKNFKNSTKASIIIYCDFESIIKKINGKNKTAKHEICAYGYKIISLNNFLAEHNIEDFKIFTGSKAIFNYIKTLFNFRRRTYF